MENLKVSKCLFQQPLSWWRLSDLNFTITKIKNNPLFKDYSNENQSNIRTGQGDHRKPRRQSYHSVLSGTGSGQGSDRTNQRQPTVLEMIRKDREAPEHEQTIKVMFTQGRRGTEIAQELGLCRKLVNRIIYDRLKLRSTRPRVNTNYTDEQVNRIIHLYRWGYDVFEIKEEMGGTVYKIQNVLKYAGEIERLAD